MKIKELKKLTDQQLSQLKTLEITETLDKKYINDLIALLPKLRSLEIFSCKGSKLKGKLFTSLVQQLPQCPLLSYLFFPNNQINNEDLKSFAAVLPKFKCLVAVELTGNKLTDLMQDEHNILLKNIRRNGTLVSFDMSNNNVSAKSRDQINEVLSANRARGEELISAVKQQDINAVRQLLIAGARVNTRLVMGNRIISRLESPLHVAAELGDCGMVRLLKGRGAKMLPDGLGKTPLERAQSTLKDLPLHRAIWRAGLEKVIKLLSQDGVKKEYDATGYTSVSGTGLFAPKLKYHSKERKVLTLPTCS
ncbi:hypothetical protein [Legionella brunensis]|uniref:hypothetical protein n=1 Tax=Legionella brunensis TaxID=29422 RepID=UPI001041AB59|nr:hypothetical protein [Legionella brunensis]